MTAGNRVKVTNGVTQVENFLELARIRAMHITDARPASTVIGVIALATPAWHAEIVAIVLKVE